MMMKTQLITMMMMRLVANIDKMRTKMMIIMMK